MKDHFFKKEKLGYFSLYRTITTLTRVIISLICDLIYFWFVQVHATSFLLAASASWIIPTLEKLYFIEIDFLYK